MAYIDLHMHSTCSDGVLSPTQLVQAVRDADVSTMALCDHDTVSGVQEAINAGIAAGITVISGVELSVACNGYQDVHLLGYHIDVTAPALLNQLEEFAARRANRNREIVMSVNILLTAQGLIPLEIADVEALADGVIGRPHIARTLISNGYVADMEEAFSRYLIPCNVPKRYWAMADALTTLHSVGGVTVLAHPTSISKDHQILSELIHNLKDQGLDGLEVYNSMASEGDMVFLQGLARKLDLLVTGGSDFHGIASDEQPGKGRGGIRFSDALLVPLQQRADRYATRT